MCMCVCMCVCGCVCVCYVCVCMCVCVVCVDITGDRDNTTVKVLCYKPEGRWFDPSWCQWT